VLVEAGDTCHNLRSSLDHTATQLWRLNKKTPPKRGANFPIYARALNQRDRHKMQAALKGMRAEHRDYIRSKQPYRAKDDPQAWALGVIAAIDNYDKHELIHTRFLSRPTHRICQP
jgi:hypothetical protein